MAITHESRSERRVANLRWMERPRRELFTAKGWGFVMKDYNHFPLVKMGCLDKGRNGFKMKGAIV